MEFQILNAKIANCLAKSNHSSAISYWVNEMDTRTNALAKAYGISVDSLITQWESWVFAVEVARAKVGA